MWPQVRKLLTGDGAEQLLPFGLSKLREWVQMFRGLPFSQTFQKDGATINIKQIGEHQYLRIDAAGPYFEFFTPGYPAFAGTYLTDVYFFERYQVACVGTTLLLGKDDLGVDKIVLQPGIRGRKRVLEGSEVSKVARPCQVNMFDEPVSYLPSTTTTFPRALYESWAPGHAHTGVYSRCLNIMGAVGTWRHRPPYSTHFLRDLAFDIPYQDGSYSKNVRKAIIRSVDWPRANGVQKVVDSLFGTREFAVYVDAYNQFTVFPLSQIQSFNADGSQNISNLYVKTLYPLFPSWCYLPTDYAAYFVPNNGLETWFIAQPELDWKFNHLGTKACSVVYERQSADFDSVYHTTDIAGAPNPSPIASILQSQYMGFAARHSLTFFESILPQRYILGTGLIEVDVQIVLTGFNPEDFTFTVPVNEIRRPTTSEYCTFMAGYSWMTTYDDETLALDKRAVTASAGDLLTLDIERYFQPLSVDGMGNPSSGKVSFFSLKNLTAPAEIRTLPGTALVDYDWPTVSFVVELQDRENITHSVKLLPGPFTPTPVIDGAYEVVHRATAIYTKGQLRDVLFPETMDQAPKDRLTAASLLDQRTRIQATPMDTSKDWEYLPLNDVRTWTDASAGGLKQLRDHYASSAVFGWKTPGLEPYQSADYTLRLKNWWEFAMSVYFAPTALFSAVTPNPGWHMYADEIVNRLYVTPFSTFFVHPNGTWAYYDQSVLYNKHGVPLADGILNTLYDTLTPFIEDDQAIEHVIYDKAHFVLKKADGTEVTRDTTFRELYSEPAPKEDGTDDTNKFEPVTVQQLRATLTKNTFDGGGGIYILELGFDWAPEFSAKYVESIYHGGVQYGVGGLPANAGGLLDGTVGGIFYRSDYSGQFSPQISARPITFTQCLLTGV